MTALLTLEFGVAAPWLRSPRWLVKGFGIIRAGGAGIVVVFPERCAPAEEAAISLEGSLGLFLSASLLAASALFSAMRSLSAWLRDVPPVVVSPPFARRALLGCSDGKKLVMVDEEKPSKEVNAAEAAAGFVTVGACCSSFFKTGSVFFDTLFTAAGAPMFCECSFNGTIVDDEAGSSSSRSARS